MTMTIAIVAAFGAQLSPVGDLGVGDKLPDTRKIPLLSIETRPYRPQPGRSPGSLEDRLLTNGVAIVHFTSPRPKDGAEATFIQELSALQRAALGVSYPCNAVAIVPFGEKGAEDASVLLDASEQKVWGDPHIYWEPTFPRPGLYRTFRPNAGGGGERPIETPLTFLIGPGREILAVREPGDGEDLYAWLKKSLPAEVKAVPKDPTTNVSLPEKDAWVWAAFGRTADRQPQATRLPNTLPYTYLAWQLPIGRTFASPVVLDNTIYVNTDSAGLRAVALSTGQSLLAYGLGPSWWTSPAVAGPYVFAATANGTVFCLERANFRFKWRRDLQGLITSSPIVSGGALYIGSRNGKVFALDAETGETLWEFQTGGEISSSPAVSRGVVLIGSGDRNLYAIDARTGIEKWSFVTEGAVDSSPTVVDDEVVFGSFDGAVYSVNLQSGKQNWKSQLEGWVHSSPAVSDRFVYVGTVSVRPGETQGFNWIDRKTGERRGRFETPDDIYSSPTIWGDAVLVGCRDYNLYAFDKEMKQTQPLWTFRTRSYVHASPVVVGDTALVASFDGNLYALRQAKPIEVWTDGDVVPRWFIAALARQLHKETADLIDRAARGKVGDELRLTKFDALFKEVKARVAKPDVPPRTLPRDVPPTLPGATFIEYALTAGLLTGYPDGTFRPNDPSSRYQFAFALASVLESVARPDYVWRVLGERNGPPAQVEVRVVPPSGAPRTPPSDVPDRHWSRVMLAQLAETGLLVMDDERRFRGERLVTLRDVAEQWDRIVDGIRVVRVK